MLLSPINRLIWIKYAKSKSALFAKSTLGTRVECPLSAKSDIRHSFGYFRYARCGVMVAARLVEMPEMTKQTSAMSQITPLPMMAPTSAGLSQMTTPLRCPSKCPQKAAFMTPNT